MAQAKKKKRKQLKENPFRQGGMFKGVFRSLGVLVIGMAIGSLVTTFWIEWRQGNSEIGSGIKRMMEASSQRSTDDSTQDPSVAVKPEPQKINYDFYTVLPEIEVVVSEDDLAILDEQSAKSGDAAQASQEQASAQLAATASSVPEQSTQPPAVQPKVSQPPVREAQKSAASSYMLQAGSFSRPAEADQQKARIALLGLSSNIQKVTIQGRGDFYRVRLGPYSDYKRMEETSKRLDQEGIQTMRLKMTRSNQRN